MAGDIGAQFRALHRKGTPFIIPNPWDVGTAKLFEAQGFKAVATTSSGLAMSMGKGDGELDFDTVFAHCRALCEAIDIPVAADLENGLGHSPEDSARTIREAADTGLAGASIEDFTGDEADPIYDFKKAVERVAAAAEAARGLDRDFVFTARCENYLHGRSDLDDTIKRLVAYAEAGADVLYAPGLPDVAAIRKVVEAVGKPVNVLTGIRGLTFPVLDLAEAGVARISLGSAMARVAFEALARAGAEMLATGRFGFVNDTDHIAPLEAAITGKK
ncbi:isocitrate lyase/PEP mutase family protein [Cucumibacter marinus]|uniref:isocitrate lyase/PEP mutase family protein n=1 Tax=Cucumibacter marinus TaxID=1121252 RepID=UPI0003F7CCA7|nr:isocitrate lyase/phosphoenolpyruvate mutase family protein [Cucumibacter marinus]